MTYTIPLVWNAQNEQIYTDKQLLRIVEVETKSDHQAVMGINTLKSIN